MRAVTVLGLARRVIELLDLRPCEPFDIAKTRDGHVLLTKEDITCMSMNGKTRRASRRASTLGGN